MAVMTITDLPASRLLDGKAMSSIRGGGAPLGWMIGAFRTPAISSLVPFNFYQTNNFFVDQMINQFQIIDVDNSGSNSTITLDQDNEATNDLARALKR